MKVSKNSKFPTHKKSFENPKRPNLSDFQTSIVEKHQEIFVKKKIFGKKVLQCQKNRKGGPLGIF